MSRPRRKILLVEDETSITEPLVEALRGEGFDAEVAGTVAQALELARRDPDLVLLDVMLPDGSGLDVCRELRRSSQVPIIMLTARGGEGGRAGRGARPRRGSRARRGRLHRQAVQRARGDRADPRGPAAERGTGAGRPGRARGRGRAARPGSSRRDPARRGARAEPQGVRAPATADAKRRLGGHAGAADRRGLGPELVWLDEDPRRARERPAAQARRRPSAPALPAHVARRGLPLLVSRRSRMSLRLQLLGAFAYVLLLIIVALEVPLALNLARRIDAEVKNEAAAQAFVVAASASGRIHRSQQLAALVRTSASDLGARVLVVGAPGGRLLADSAGQPVGQIYRSPDRPEIASALRGERTQGERHSETLGEDLLYTAVPITNEAKVVGAVRVTQ